MWLRPCGPLRQRGQQTRATCRNGSSGWASLKRSLTQEALEVFGSEQAKTDDPAVAARKLYNKDQQGTRRLQVLSLQHGGVSRVSLRGGRDMLFDPLQSCCRHRRCGCCCWCCYSLTDFTCFLAPITRTTMATLAIVAVLLI